MQVKILTIFLILIIGAIGTFGFLGLSLTESGHSSCPISSVLGGDCSSISNAFALAIHHISGLQFLSQFTISFNSTMLVLFSLFFAFLLFVYIRRQNALRSLFLQKCFTAEKSSPHIDKKILRWIALHSKRDPHMPF